MPADSGAPASFAKGRAVVASAATPASVGAAERYVLKDFAGSSHRLLASWVRDLPPDLRVLELGPGTAQVARLAERKDLRWFGLEGSVDCLGALAETLSGGAIVDLERLDRLPRGFDVAVAADLLEHLSAPEAMLRRLADALPAGAPLLISVPNVANVWIRLQLLCGRFPYADRGILDRTHLVFFTRKTLEEMLARAGFAVERRAASTIPLPLAFPHWPRVILGALMGLLGAMTRGFPKLFGFQLLVFARRRSG